MGDRCKALTTDNRHNLEIKTRYLRTVIQHPTVTVQPSRSNINAAVMKQMAHDSDGTHIYVHSSALLAASGQQCIEQD